MSEVSPTYNARPRGDGGFCTTCGHRVGSFEGLKACPACGSAGIHCADANQVDVNVNWHELHILCVWAENFARQHDLQTTVFTIARRLQAQHPDRHPLTLAGELGDLAKQHDIQVSDPKLGADAQRFKLGEHS